jgi:hypothetical protein
MFTLRWLFQLEGVVLILKTSNIFAKSQNYSKYERIH